MLTERQKQNAQRELSEVIFVPGWKQHRIKFDKDGTEGEVEVDFAGKWRLYWVRRVGNKWLLLSFAGYRACECGYFRTFTGAVKKIVSYAKRDCITS